MLKKQLKYFIAILLFSNLSSAGERKLTLKEHLNREWTGEMLTYSLTFPRGECTANSVRLSGPDGPLACQLSALEKWPGTEFVKSLKLSFVVERLASRTTREYVVSFGEVDSEVAQPAADLNVSAKQGTVEIRTSRFGILLTTGKQEFPNPVEAQKAPKPVQSMRLANGTEFGGSRLYGKGRIRSWSSKVLASGPVSVRVGTLYEYENGNRLRLGFQVNAGDEGVLVDSEVAEDQTEDGWELFLTSGLKVKDAVLVIGQRKHARELTRKLTPKRDGPQFYLTPWCGDTWFPDSPTAFRLRLDDEKEELHVSAREVGVWTRPQRRPSWAKFNTWYFDTILKMWAGWQGARIEVVDVRGGVAMRSNLRSGERKFTVSATQDGAKLFDRFRCKRMSVHSPMPRLNEVKDMILEWPDGKEKHPFLFLNAKETAAAITRNPKGASQARNIGDLRDTLDSLGTIDLMRGVIHVAALYDMLIDSDLVKPEERSLLRAQAAYLAYKNDSPLHWSIERGWCSGNPNMTVSRVAATGLMGLALEGHPMSKKWANHCIDWMKYWLDEVTSKKGGWPESSHYARVSWADFVQMAVAARNRGAHDFFKHPKFRAMSEFYEKTLTPPDPLRWVHHHNRASDPRPGARVTAPYGRGTRGDAWSLNGILARATAKSDPEWSKVMQWSWQESGNVHQCSHSTAGVSSLYMDPSLPAAKPDWKSEYFPTLGYIFRNHVGERFENYLLFVSEYYKCPDGHLWPADTGSIAKWFANGRPVGGNFQRIPETSHVLLESRVMLACNWDPAEGKSSESGYVTIPHHEGTAYLPGSDYTNVRFEIPEIKEHHRKMNRKAPAFPPRKKVGVAPFEWRRQILNVHDEKPDGVNYMILRDTVRGGQPTQWHFWSLSEKLGTPEEAANRESFLKDKPGHKKLAYREIRGNRFTALGQFDVDLEYYIASPLDTQRHTMRFGNRSSAYGIAGTFDEYQDLLHLRLEDDGTYFVAMFPHYQKAKSPNFTTLGDGTIIKIEGDFGTDYAFLSEAPKEAEAKGISFSGTGASIQSRTSGVNLTLAAPGEVSFGKHQLSTEFNASLQAGKEELRLTFSNCPGGEVTFRSPGNWKLGRERNGVTLKKKWGKYVMSVPKGTAVIELVEK